MESVFPQPAQTRARLPTLVRGSGAAPADARVSPRAAIVGIGMVSAGLWWIIWQAAAILF